MLCTLLMLLLLCSLSVVNVNSYEYYYCQRCTTTPFVLSKSYMGGNFASTSVQVVVKRGTTVLTSGSSYVPGETLTLSISTSSGVGGKAFQVSAGAITGGSCTAATGIRLCGSASQTASWILPSSGDITAQVSWALASSNAKTYFSPLFVLVAPAAPPTQAPSAPAPTRVPTVLPTSTPGVPTLTPTNNPPTRSPTRFPTQAPTPIPPTPLPTFAPSMQSSSYSLIMSAQFAGLTSDDVIRETDSMTNLISGSLQSQGVVQMDVSILSVASNLRRRLSSTTSTTSTSSSSSNSTSDTNLMTRNADSASAVIRAGRSLLEGIASLGTSLSTAGFRRKLTGVSVRFQVNNFPSLGSANAAQTLLQAYLTDATTAGFVSQMNTAYSLSMSAGSVTVTSATTMDTSLAGSIASYEHSCSLSTVDKLYWTVSPDRTHVTAFMLHQGPSTTNQDYISVGLVGDAVNKMVAPSSAQQNRVYMYIPTVPSAAYFYAIQGYQADQLVYSSNPQRTTTNQGVQTVQSIDNYVSMTFAYNVDSGDSSDVPLKLGAGLANNVMYASGEVWPMKHNSYGFTSVYWVDGTCQFVPKQAVGPAVIWFLLGAIVLFNGKISPFRSVFRFVPGLNTLRRLHPTVLSRWVGKNVAHWLALGEESSQTYSIPSVMGVLLYVAATILVFVHNHIYDGFALATGRVAVMNMWLALIPTTKSSAILYLTGVPFERCVKYHKMVTYTGIVFSVIHLLASRLVMIAALGEGMGDIFSFKPYGSYKVLPGMGTVAVICYGLMSLLAFEFIRKAKYEVFYVVHQLWLVAIVMNMLHFQLGSFNQLLFLPGLILQLIDKLWVCKKYPAELTAISALSAVSDGGESQKSVIEKSVDAVSLRVIMHDRDNTSSMYYANAWKKLVAFTRYCFVDYKKFVDSGLLGSDAEYDSFHGGLGQYYFINLPSYSDVQWHPFSVSEIIEGPREGLATGGFIQFHIKNMGPGTFTGHLASMAQAHSEIARSERQDIGPLNISVKLSGPHGSLSVNLADYQHIVLIAGGIGITPMLPVLDRIRHWCRKEKAKKFPRLERVSVLWVTRQDNKSLFAEFADRVVQNPLGFGQDPGGSFRATNPAIRSTGDLGNARQGGIQLNAMAPAINLQTVSPEVSARPVSANDNVGAASASTSSPAGRPPRPARPAPLPPSRADGGVAPKASATLQKIGQWVGEPALSADANVNAGKNPAMYAAPESNVKWDAYFYVTACSDGFSSFRTSSGGMHDCIIGRPNLPNFMQTAVNDGTGKSVCALLCGPAAMTTDAAKVCADLRVDYHLETFGW